MCFITVCPSENCLRKYKWKYAFHKYCFRDSICVRLSEWKITKPSLNHSNLFSYTRTKSKRSSQRSEIFNMHQETDVSLCLKSKPRLSSWRYLLIILEVSTSSPLSYSSVPSLVTRQRTLVHLTQALTHAWKFPHEHCNLSGGLPRAHPCY